MHNAARPNLLPTAAFVSLLVLLLGATGLFALHYTQARSAAGLARLDDIEATVLAAVETRAGFKTQVQEWKNVLLRGQNSSDLAAYRARFEQQETAVQTSLFTLKGRLTLLGLDPAPAETLIADHVKLGAAYREALAAYRPGDPASVFAVDARLRGIDRPLNDRIDALADTVQVTAVTERKTLAEAAAGRYAALRKATLVIGSLTVLAAFWLVFQANRAGRPA